RILAGDAYAALGDTERAVEAYEGVLTSYRVNWRDSDTWAPLIPLAHERLGGAYMALADTAQAVEHLSALAKIWKDADPELQQRVSAARDRAAELQANGGN
ncbi:MAG: hypothetical protein KJO06_01245, partial [Gemmatimonadetes bacterium]|nr:hypothetical protein [Gemmatimonadota bacterium]